MDLFYKFFLILPCYLDLILQIIFFNYSKNYIISRQLTLKLTSSREAGADGKALTGGE